MPITRVFPQIVTTVASPVRAFPQTPIQIAPATTSALGTVKMSTAPVSAASPIAVGDNDSRMTNSRPPNGLAGGDLAGSYPNPTVGSTTGTGAFVKAISPTLTGNTVVEAINGPSADGFRSNLIVVQTSSTQVNVLADAITLVDGSSNARTFRSINSTVAITTSGAGGLDTGSEAANTWYAVYVIAKTDGTVNTLLSTNIANSPTMPSGYSFRRRVAMVRNNGSSNFEFFQKFNDWVITGNMATVGTVTSTTAADMDLSAYVPRTSRFVLINMYIRASSTSTNYVQCTAIDKTSGQIVSIAYIQGDTTFTGWELMDQAYTTVNASGVTQFRVAVTGTQTNIRITGYLDQY